MTRLKEYPPMSDDEVDGGHWSNHEPWEPGDPITRCIECFNFWPCPTAVEHGEVTGGR